MLSKNKKLSTFKVKGYSLTKLNILLVYVLAKVGVSRSKYGSLRAKKSHFIVRLFFVQFLRVIEVFGIKK